jgi:cell filamentation protein, protein adenylyltransferase
LNAKEFAKMTPGRLVRAMPLSAEEQNLVAFVPAPLPPVIPLTNKLFNLTSDVSNALGRLQGIAGALPDPKILIRSFVRREAQLSSYIENTYANYEEVAAADQDEPKHSLASDDVRETLNAERAIEVGVEAVFTKGYPVTNNLLRQMHRVLLSGVRGEECAGHFRQKQVYIGRETEGVDHARFVPTPPHLLNDLMSDFESYARSKDVLPALVQIGLVHYQFETIHPFKDGNGRLGRILILLGLCQHALLKVPLINASLYFERNKQMYYDALLNVSTHGDWTGWLLFFLEGLRVAANESIQKLQELTAMQRDYHERLRSARNTALLLTLADNLFIRPVVTISQAAEIMGVTYQAAQNSVRKLVDAKILEVRPRATPATFVAKEILRAVNPRPTSR